MDSVDCVFHFVDMCGVEGERGFFHSSALSSSVQPANAVSRLLGCD